MLFVHAAHAPTWFGRRYNHTMVIEFQEEAIWWKGPAPFVFVPVPAELSAEIKAVSSRITYGWGVIPVKATIGDTEYTTSLFPKNGLYLVPVKTKVQKAENVHVGDRVPVRLELELKGGDDNRAQIPSDWVEVT